MNGLVYHIASGQAFFSGLILVLTAATLGTTQRPWARRVALVAFVAGVLAIAVSSTPQPFWIYALAAATALVWLGACFRQSARRLPRYVLAIACIALALLELPYHLRPTVSPAGSRSFTILADSLTAGMGASDTAERWPELLAREHAVVVQDLSHVGETAASATKRAARQPIASELVLIEIGGNDVLGATAAEQFEQDLAALLTSVASGNRQVIMFELPLPPFYHRFGQIQRRLAYEHGVALIPKRALLSILAPRVNTVDTIHLTPAGHREMAALVWGVLEPAYATTTR